MRQQLLARRELFAAGPDAVAANAMLASHLATLLQQLEPELLGLYWPHRSEFNAAAALCADTVLARLPKALPFARRAPTEMHYRAWDGRTPTLADECGILSCDGAIVVPDVVLVPCVGFTSEGYRLGYGGGYFDRWLARNPGVTTVGVAWSNAAITPGAFEQQAHDQPMTLVVTERGVA